LLKHMKTHKHLKPGENGTLRLVERFGDTLLCVRYRYDAIRDMRIKTAEIIVDERPGKGVPRIRETDIVNIQVPFTMKALRERLKGVGAKWDPVQKLWRVRWGLIRGETGNLWRGLLKGKRSSLYKEYNNFLILGINS
jgi:hypothetical protein